jgi:ABC-type Fe3+/spermidine/putrescine transport system ATPase subunit
MRIECEGGFALMVPGGEQVVGDAVTVGIRPEHVELAPAEGENVVDGRVTERVYKGASLDLHVDVAGTDCTVAVPASTLAADAVPQIGASLRLRFPRGHLVLLA